MEFGRGVPVGDDGVLFVFTSTCKTYRFFKVVDVCRVTFNVQRNSLDAGWVNIGKAKTRHQAEMKCMLNQRRNANV